MAMEIGIIGFGSFGKFMALHLAKRFKIFVYDIAKIPEESCSMQVTFSSLEEVLKKDVIILAVPMESLEKTLYKIKDKIKENSLVMDVCSLKMFSCSLMDKILPKNIEIIGTHPLFGEKSAKNNIRGMKIALCNVRSSRLEKVKTFCEQLGLKVIITSPEEHDKQMAFSQALTHFIGRTAQRSDIKRVALSTKTFDDLMDIIEVIKEDSSVLFENMQTMNPFASEIRSRFLEEARKLHEHLLKPNIK